MMFVRKKSLSAVRLFKLRVINQIKIPPMPWLKKRNHWIRILVDRLKVNYRIRIRMKTFGKIKARENNDNIRSAIKTIQQQQQQQHNNENLDDRNEKYDIDFLLLLLFLLNYLFFK